MAVEQQRPIGLARERFEEVRFRRIDGESLNVDRIGLQPIFDRGEEELEQEDNVRRDIRNGDSIYEVWDRYGTL